MLYLEYLTYTFNRFPDRRDRRRHLMADLRMSEGVGRGEVCVCVCCTTYYLQELSF